MPTPLAKVILKNLTLPIYKRKFDDAGGILRQITGAEYFEISDVWDPAETLLRYFREPDDGVPPFVALPAPSAWLEWKDDDGVRYGALMIAEDRELTSGEITFVTESASGIRFGFNYSNTKKPWMRIPYGWKADRDALEKKADRDALEKWVLWRIPCLLSVINTPKLTKRIVHSSRRQIKRRSSQGRWPSNHTWTEIKFYIDEATHRDPTVIGPLTGRKALHHVRTFWRCRMGRWEKVRSHFRGDASLGIVRSRYKPSLRNPVIPPYGESPSPPPLT